MKLNEVKSVAAGEYDLKEGIIPVHITMTLEQIIRDGKITNPVQYFVVGALVEMFKYGGPHRWPRDLNAYSMTTSAELIDNLKSLDEQTHSGLAAWLIAELQGPATFETNPYAKPQMGTVEWINWVLQKQK